MNFWYNQLSEINLANPQINLHNSEFYQPEFRKTKRWKRYVTAARNQYNNSLDPDFLKHQAQRYQNGTSLFFCLSDNDIKSCERLDQFFRNPDSSVDAFSYGLLASLITYWNFFVFEAVTDNNKANSKDAEAYQQYYAAFLQQAYGVSEVSPASAKQNFPKFCQERFEILQTINDNLPQILQMINQDFDETCFRRLSYLLSHDLDINMENYYRNTLPLNKAEEVYPLFLQTLEFLISDIASLQWHTHRNAVTRDYQKQAARGLLKDNYRFLEENQKLTRQVTELTKQVSSLQSSTDNLNAGKEHYKAKTKQEYKDQISALQQEIQALKKKNSQLQKKLNQAKKASKPEHHSFIPPLSTLSALSVEPAPITVDHSLHYAFIIDGDGPVLTKLQAEYPNALFLTGLEKLRSLQPDAVPLVILSVKFSHHTSLEQYKALCKTRGIPFFYWNNTNTQQLDQMIAKELPSAIIPANKANKIN